MGTRSWFLFNGSVAAGAETNPNNFFYLSFEPICEGGDVLCAILGIYQPNPYRQNPAPQTFSSGRMQIYITAAKATQAAYPDPAIGQQPYALTKS